MACSSAIRVSQLYYHNQLHHHLLPRNPPLQNQKLQQQHPELDLQVSLLPDPVLLPPGQLHQPSDSRLLAFPPSPPFVGQPAKLASPVFPAILPPRVPAPHKHLPGQVSPHRSTAIRQKPLEITILRHYRQRFGIWRNNMRRIRKDSESLRKSETRGIDLMASYRRSRPSANLNTVKWWN